MKKIIDFIKQNMWYLIAVLVVIIFFYYQMAISGIATHDELQNFYQVRLGEYFEGLHWERWGMALMNALPSYVHACCTNIYTYKAMTLVGVLASCIAFFVFLKKTVGEKKGLLFLILFFLFAQFNLEHDGLYSFSFSYQLNTCYVFIALSLYYDYLRNRKKRYLISSAIFYLLSSMAYEAFVLYGILFFILDVHYLVEQKKLSILNLFKDLILHASLVTIYVLSYMYVSAHSSFKNLDASVGTKITPISFLVTEWNLTIGLFPLRYHLPWKILIEGACKLTIENIVRIFIILFVVDIIYFLVSSANEISIKQYLQMTSICVVGMFLPGVLLSVTDKFIGWIYELGVLSFGVSYYSYFFIVALIVITIVFLYQRLPLKNVFLSVCCIGIGIIAEFTFISNSYYIGTLAEQEDKYELFDEIVKTDYFMNLDPGSMIYAPDLYGLHGNMNELSRYATEISGTDVVIVNNKEAIDYDRNLYYWRFDLDDDISYLSHVDSNLAADEIFVYADYSLEGYGVIADIVDTNISTLYIDNNFLDTYYDSIIIPDINVLSNCVCLKCNDVVPDSIEVYKTSGSYDYGIMDISGFRKLKEWGRWGNKECLLSLRNTMGIDTVLLDMELEIPDRERAIIEVGCGDFTQEIEVIGKTSVQVNVPVADGDNDIRIVSVDAGDASDSKIVKFYKFDVMLKENVINLCNIR